MNKEEKASVAIGFPAYRAGQHVELSGTDFQSKAIDDLVVAHDLKLPPLVLDPMVFWATITGVDHSAEYPIAVDIWGHGDRGKHPGPVSIRVKPDAIVGLL